MHDAIASIGSILSFGLTVWFSVATAAQHKKDSNSTNCIKIIGQEPTSRAGFNTIS